MSKEIRELNLVPSQVREFYDFKFVMAKLENCDEMRSSNDQLCSERFQFCVQLVLRTGESIELGKSRLDIIVPKADKGDFELRLKSAVQAMLVELKDEGALVELGVGEEASVDNGAWASGHF